MSVPRMIPGFADRIFDVLVEVCRIPENSSNRANFVYTFEVPSKEEPSSEWRFGSTIGFGGKFRYPAVTVDAYRDHGSEEVAAIIELANKHLAAIKHQMEIEGWTEFK